MAITLLLLTLCQLYLHAVEGSIEDVPLGHLKPFGEHTTPSPVEERYDLPSAQEFWEKYAKPLKPVIFRGINKQSPVFTKWTDEYLKEHYGDMEMRVEVKREVTEMVPEGDKGLARDTLRNFINTYHGNTTKYVISDLPTPMYKDFLVPPFVGCGSFAERMVEVDVWMGGGGSSSKIHRDAFHIINCLFNGTKEWKMIEKKHEKNIYKVPEEKGRLSGISYIDPMKVDLKKFPKVQKVPWHFVNVTPGDCLFIPRQMWHQVRSFGMHNFAISLLFSRFVKHETLDFSDCPANGFRPLSEFDPDWKYPGNGSFTMGNADLVYGTKRDLYQMLDEKDDLNLPDVRNSIKSVETFKKHGRTDQEVDKLVEQFYNAFGKQVGDRITRADVRALKKESLRKITMLWNIADPYGTPEYEYCNIDANNIINVLNGMFENEAVVSKKTFMDSYVSQLKGTKKIGEDFFTKLGGGETDSITKDAVLENINKAIDKYDECDMNYHERTEYGEEEPPVTKPNYRSMMENPGQMNDTMGEEDTGESDDDENDEDDGMNGDDETEAGNRGEEAGDDDDESTNKGTSGSEDDADGADEGDNDNEDQGDDDNENEGNDSAGDESTGDNDNKDNDSSESEDNGENKSASEDTPEAATGSDKNEDVREKDEL